MKKLLVILITIVMLCTMVACGSKPSSVETDEPKDTEASFDTKEPDSTQATNNNLNSETIEGLENVIKNDVSKTISDLEKEWEGLSSEIKSYNDYNNNSEKIKSYYEKINTETSTLCNRMLSYSVKYAELVMAIEESTDDQYDAMDDLYDTIYDDGGDDIYDGTYDGVLDDMYDDLYDGVLDDRDDSIPYKDWYDVRSKEYKLWSNTRSDIYDIWSDMRSDVYEFWSDLRSELWDDDTEKTNKVISEFKQKISGEANTTQTTLDTTIPETKTSETEAAASNYDWKQLLKDYEAWVDDYIAFMEKYKANPSDFSLLSDYANMMTEYAEWADKVDKMDDNISDSDALEYAAELSRIATKLAEAAY